MKLGLSAWESVQSGPLYGLTCGPGQLVGPVDPAAKHLLQLPHYERTGEGEELCQ